MSVTAVGLDFPNISPVAISIGSFDIHWYGIGYLVAVLFAWIFSKYLLRQSRLWPNNKAPFPSQYIDDLVNYAVLGIVLGGRLGYVLLYNSSYYLAHPENIIKIWDGGMAFHGGLFGVMIAFYLFSRKYKIKLLSLMDLMSICATIGIGLVRICNFINSELWGRETNMPWGVKFPNGGVDQYGNLISRHPSQLYEAATEGFLLFIILLIAVYFFKIFKKTGLAAGIFATGYGLSRIFVEFFREPDQQLGYLYQNWLTMGMVLSLPLIIIGSLLIINAMKKQHDPR